jgi:hypothetical protein
MSGKLQLSEQLNPSAQTFVVDEPVGSVLTGVGLFFAQAPTGSSAQPVSIELRPCAESGAPSAKKFIQGTKVTVAASTVAAAANTNFASAAEVKFSFREPVYIAGNTLLALVISTGASADQYKIWVGKNGEHLTNSTTEFFSSTIERGAFYESSNGTSWRPDNEKDLAYKVYRAEFTQQNSFAVFHADAPPAKRLTEQTLIDDNTKYPADPFIFTAGSKLVDVVHPAHGFQVGDKVVLSKGSNGFDSSDTINGITGSNLYGTKTITAADPYGYTFNCGGSANATASIRAGGAGVLATEQYVVDQFQTILPAVTPPKTNMFAVGDFLASKSFGGNETAYSNIADVRIKKNYVQGFKNPAVIASARNLKQIIIQVIPLLKLELALLLNINTRLLILMSTLQQCVLLVILLTTKLLQLLPIETLSLLYHLLLKRNQTAELRRQNIFLLFIVLSLQQHHCEC